MNIIDKLKMPRGRPRKNKKIDNIMLDLEQDDINNINNINDAQRQKRKYIRKKKPEQNKADDGTIIKPEAKKRGRKRGRKKKEQELLLKPDEILAYMIRNFPYMGIEKIKDKVINGLQIMKDIGDNPYLLYKFIHEDKTYYYDDMNTILNADGQIVGFFIKQPDETNKMCMIDRKNRDIRTFQEVINEIECS